MVLTILQVLSIAAGLSSAAAWLYASQVKVSRENALEIRRRDAQKSGLSPDLSGMTFEGWEMRETLAAQSKWNSVGAILAAAAVATQSVASLLA